MVLRRPRRGPRQGRRRTAATGTAVVALLALGAVTACSDGDGGPSAGPASTTASAPAPDASEPGPDSGYDDPDHWICRPDLDDVCDDEYPLSEVAADGTVTDVPYVVAEQPDVDCFYLYPTSSGDAGLNSDLDTDNEVQVTRLQAAPFNQACRLYVPEYRSVTLAGLTSGRFEEGFEVAYRDVREAWRHYLDHAEAGRPVVLLGHSQGAFLATRLLREEVDPDFSQRERLLSAMLAGASFQVAPGDDVGGDARHVPLCAAPDEYGCVVTWQTYRVDDPPRPGALFGAPAGDTASACTNPAALTGGPAEPRGGYGSVAWALPGAGDAIDGVRVDVPGLVSVECQERDGYHYLAVTVHGESADPRADDIPGDGLPNWGLHLVDVDVVQESLVDLVRTQSAAYQAAR